MADEALRAREAKLRAQEGWRFIQTLTVQQACLPSPLPHSPHARAATRRTGAAPAVWRDAQARDYSGGRLRGALARPPRVSPPALALLTPGRRRVAS